MASLLLVEDDLGIAKAITIRLNAAGHDLQVVSDGARALDAFQQSSPDLVLLDWTLPGKSGLELARELRARPEGADTPLVFLTASKRPEIRSAAEELRAAGFFEKPFDAKELVRLIEETLQGRSVPAS